MGVGRRIMTNHLRRLSAYDIINCIEWYLPYADDHLLIMLDRLAATLRPSADRHGDGSWMSDDARIMRSGWGVLSESVK